MNAFREHHQHNIRMHYRCFDRILLNGIIQPFQQEERVVGFFNTYRKVYPVSRNLLREIASQFHNWVKDRSQKWRAPILEAPAGRRDDFVDRYFKRAKADQVVCILNAREPARILTAIGNQKENRWHLELKQRWVEQYNFYLNDRQWGRMFVRVCPYFPFSARLCLNQHHWLANRLRQQGIRFEQPGNAFLNCSDPEALQKLADSLTAQDLIRCGQKWLAQLTPFFTERERRQAGVQHRVWPKNWNELTRRSLHTSCPFPEIAFSHPRIKLTRIEQKVKASTEAESVSRDNEKRVDRELIHELMKRGISEKTSAELLRNLCPDQQIMDQLEWGDHLLRNAPRGKFYNPAGILIALIKDNVIPPETFETSRKRKLRETAEQARDQQRRESARLELAYIEYKDQQLAAFITKRWSGEELPSLVETKKREMLQQDRWKRLLSFNQDSLEQAALRQVRADIATTVSFLTFSEFREKVQANSPHYLIQSPLDFRVPALLKT